MMRGARARRQEGRWFSSTFNRTTPTPSSCPHAFHQSDSHADVPPCVPKDPSVLIHYQLTAPPALATGSQTPGGAQGKLIQAQMDSQPADRQATGASDSVATAAAAAAAPAAPSDSASTAAAAAAVAEVPAAQSDGASTAAAAADAPAAQPIAGTSDSAAAAKAPASAAGQDIQVLRAWLAKINLPEAEPMLDYYDVQVILQAIRGQNALM